MRPERRERPVSRPIARRLDAFDELVSSDLLVAEVRAAMRRERVESDAVPLLSTLAWILPDRPLHAEIGRVLESGYVRGADCWHLATALYLAEDPASMSFLTLDVRQAKGAGVLGFGR